MGVEKHKAVAKLTEDLIEGRVKPWSAERAAHEAGLPEPENIGVAAAARRAFVEHLTGVEFKHLPLPEKPWAIEYRCPKDKSVWTMVDGDDQRTCTLCGTELVPSVNDRAPVYKKLVENYIGGAEDYYSYAGQVGVTGDVEKTFQNILCYGPGVGHLGVAAGCFQLNRFGPVEVSVARYGYAARNLSFVFADEAERELAREAIRNNVGEIGRTMVNDFLGVYEGEVYYVNFLDKQYHDERILHVTFHTRFPDYRGHGCTSQAVGRAKVTIDKIFAELGIACKLSVVGMGLDGDLKPSPRNRRGRYVSARQRIPVAKYEGVIGRPIEDFFSYIELDRQGVTEETGWPAYTGMGGEIIPAFYRAMKTNPRPYLVSCYQKVNAEIRGSDLVFGVELPNVEVGVVSGPEGLVPPSAREVMRACGVNTAAEYCAALAAITLGGEFNFATLHIREKLYTGK